MALLNDENWYNQVIRVSGKSTLLLENAYNIISCFDDFNLLPALEDTVRIKKQRVRLVGRTLSVCKKSVFNMSLRIYSISFSFAR